MPIASTLEGISINRSEVCRYLGYARGQNLTPSISSLIDRQIEEAQRLIKPSHTFIVRKVLATEGPHTFIEGPVAFTSSVITGVLSKCHEVAILVTTIGGELEKRTSQLMKEGEMLKAMVLDAIGSTAVEQAANHLRESVRDKAATVGAEISLRYSPGYCDWNIKQQKLLFDALQGDSAGVKLSEDYLMAPQKSISGVIGIGFDRAITTSSCHSCTKKDCPGRRI